jgi:hypothetical protein
MIREGNASSDPQTTFHVVREEGKICRLATGDGFRGFTRKRTLNLLAGDILVSRYHSKSDLLSERYLVWRDEQLIAFATPLAGAPLLRLSTDKTDLGRLSRYERIPEEAIELRDWLMLLILDRSHHAGVYIGSPFDLFRGVA